jgi:predicted ester cyclase/quinol monooxygenase YgiN
MIESGTRNVLINVFTTEPDQQAAGLQALAAFGERVVAGEVPGLISASVHRSVDGTRIVNYVQWRSVEDMQRMLQTPEFRHAFAEQPALQRADLHFYEVAAVHQPGGVRPMDIYRRFQAYLLSGQFNRLPEVVDVEGYTENCVGLTGWTTGLHVALENFQRNVLAVMSDLAAEELEVVESSDSLVIRSRVRATHTGTFLGMAPTGRRIGWDSVDMYRMQAGRIVWRYLLSDWHAVVQQLA